MKVDLSELTNNKIYLIKILIVKLEIYLDFYKNILRYVRTEQMGHVIIMCVVDQVAKLIVNIDYIE
jgi:FlaA1/EpsC-like NDP-sugar epimerase